MKKILAIGMAGVLGVVGACGGADEPLTVVGVSPDNRATDVAIDSDVVLTFSQPIDPATVAAASCSRTPTGRWRSSGPTESPGRRRPRSPTPA